MEVKTWKPNPDCEQCAQAERNNYESAASGQRVYTKALSKVKSQHKEIDRLKARIAELEALLLAVESKVEGETRYETALRYIKAGDAMTDYVRSRGGKG